MKFNNTNKFYSLCWIPLIVLGSMLAACTGTSPSKPDVESEEYKKAVSDFYVSVSAIQSDQALFAIDKMQEVANTYPSEAAAWANLGVYSMRQGNFEQATEYMNKALSNNNSDIEFLAGRLESRKGNIESSLKHLRTAAQLDSTNAKILFTLADELERQDPKENAPEIMKLLNQILDQDPGNLAVLLEIIRTAAKWENEAALEQALNEMEKQSAIWPEQIQREFQEQKNSILEKKGKDITFELAFLRNNLNETSYFQNDLQKVQFPSNQVGFLITEFLWLPNVNQMAAPADNQLVFSSLEESSNSKVQLFKPVALANEQANTITIAENTATIDDNIMLEFPNNSREDRLNPNAVTVMDYNYDFLNDLVFAGPGGFKFYAQQDDSSFTDVTGSLNLPAPVLRKSYIGSWVNDFDLDGDLDLLLSAEDGESFVLRNNGDGTFDKQEPFGEVRDIQDFLWADFDQDGDQDAVILTGSGEVHYYSNERAGEFTRDTTFAISDPVRAFNFGDLNADGAFEIVSWHPDHISATSYSDSTGGWHQKTLVRIDESEGDRGSHPRLFIADLDNNGALDLMVSDQNETKYWLSDENVSLPSNVYQTPSGSVVGLSDVDGDNRLDLLGFAENGQKTILQNSGSKDYKARIISPRASGQSGDQRINSFGIGGEIESRSGLQYTKQPIDKSWVHLGLGTYEEAEMVRINWPNGTMQAEFAELGYDDQIQNEQILKGSCPWVQTYNGEEMEFVTDFLWRTALGLKINAQGEANVIHSIDWIKLTGDQLKPRDGFYDIRITADLWETHFFDHVSLMAVDYPEDTEVFVDERFTLPAPEQKLYPMHELYPVASATDHNGDDVREVIAAKDEDYLDSFSLTPYQGLAEEHYVEVEIGDEVPKQEKLKLLALGWVYPTDTSINIAISQGNYDPPHGIRVEVPDGKGGWQVAHENIGFPAGKSKTIIVDLEDVFESNTERRVRLYTNMEIYWDKIQMGVQNDEIELSTQKLSADVADLRYRGFSKLVQKDRFLPTKADYQQISGTTPKWRDLIGYYTRFGDVRELTEEIDDRYVIMNAGDELVFKFPALEQPKEGWTRDFVLIGDGWVKDGDYNTGYSKTVLPLPYHGMEDYSEEPSLLQDDPVYQEHKEDWVRYHTRYVTPQNFNTALKFK